MGDTKSVEAAKDGWDVGSLATRVEECQWEAYRTLGIEGIPGGDEGELIRGRVVGHVRMLLDRDPVIAAVPGDVLADVEAVVDDHNAHCAAEALSGFLASMRDPDGRAG